MKAEFVEGRELVLSLEELQALKFWLGVITFQGTREQIKKPMVLYDAVLGKIESALAAEPKEGVDTQTHI